MKPFRLYRYEIRREFAGTVREGQTAFSSSAMAAIFGPQFSALVADKEHFLAAALDGKNRIIGFEVVATGTLNSCPVAPRETFRFAVSVAAAAVVVMHNHPSGDPTPSVDDRRITERMRRAGELLGIVVLDHLIFGNPGSYYSFADNGWS